MSVKEIDPFILEMAIEGRNLRSSTLGAELGLEAHLLVFLRHFG